MNKPSYHPSLCRALDAVKAADDALTALYDEASVPGIHGNRILANWAMSAQHAAADMTETLTAAADMAGGYEPEQA